MKESELRKLIKLVEESDIDELEISRWWRKVRIAKNRPGGNSHLPGPVAVHPVAAPTPEPQPAPVEEKASGAKEIKSPMVGTFYRSPAPDAKPYIEVNQYITPGQVLCIIEAMKLMNEIEAEISGKITKICVENNQPVEYGQVLFLVDPNA
ncbi:MAG: acetyl-CoA carboxylase, biotin carboxyl carrier protein [candidate division Zixibacteria bacterium CG_4_9_14_3_um_filter_46_8]|nr:MAG: acetyl-CoA carboxylase, biotin carboxyl carrier protein [candidate division Zixibacteria bacterium CG_4_9_14_3_um_filter_46_8]